MRPKVIAGMLLVTVLLAAGVLVASRALRPQAPPPANAAAPSPVAVERKEAPAKPGPVAFATTATAAQGPGSNAPAPDPAHASYVRQRIAELNALAMKDDIVSRDAILAELRNPDKEIRKGALEAAIQFGDRSVVPRLQEVAAQTEDPAEKAELLAAIDYINLPSLSEYLAERQAKMAAMGLTNMPWPQTNRLGRRGRPVLTP
jgi:hypothetical protein